MKVVNLFAYFAPLRDTLFVCGLNSLLSYLLFPVHVFRIKHALGDDL